MIPFTEVAVLDRNSEYRGVPTSQLMENAGKALAEEIDARYPKGPVLFICGTGNNGGDGYVAARYLSEWRAANVMVYLIKGKDAVNSQMAEKNLEKLECEVIEDMPGEIPGGYILIDGLLGTGIQGTVREPYRSVIERINRSDDPVISIDIPSGLGADIRVKPDHTVTFHDIKEGMNAENSGEIIVRDIGIPPEAEDHTGPGELLLYPRPGTGSHKGDNGKLLVIGGGPYTGAPALAAMAAYRTGADLVHIAVPSSISSVVAGYSPSFIVHPLEGDELDGSHLERILEISETCDAILIGPGLGDKENTLSTVRKIVETVKKHVVIDADALKSFKDILPKEGSIITPHHNEFKMMAGDLSADDYARRSRVIVLLKGEEDYITDGERSKINDFGTAAMTVGGTGDTLAGVVGALLAKGLTAFNAARLGAYITARAGEFAFDKTNWGLMPEDVSESIPLVLKELINR